MSEYINLNYLDSEPKYPISADFSPRLGTIDIHLKINELENEESALEFIRDVLHKFFKMTWEDYLKYRDELMARELISTPTRIRD
ncbi:MAG: hypothetical protein MZV70_03300 [Desulfobacterales bacterium]|nr:hypothetical protein [Desulfobacterales bacterium]